MDEIIATPMSLSELANAYDVSNKIMKKWLAPYQEGDRQKSRHSVHAKTGYENL